MTSRHAYSRTKRERQRNKLRNTEDSRVETLTLPWVPCSSVCPFVKGLTAALRLAVSKGHPLEWRQTNASQEIRKAWVGAQIVKRDIFSRSY
jgi:hypothetical protein